MLNVTKATFFDIFRLIPLCERYDGEAKYHSNYKLDIEFMTNSIAESLLDSESAIFIVTSDDKAIGFIWGVCSCLPWSSNKIAMDMLLYVVPEHRGTRAGYKLLRSYEQWAASLDAKEVQISIVSGITEDRTVEFYKRLGYQEVGVQLRKQIGGKSNGEQDKKGS